MVVLTLLGRKAPATLKRTGHVPAYWLPKPSSQARVILNGEHVYLGKHGSPESREKYARLVAELSAANVNRHESVAAQPGLKTLVCRKKTTRLSWSAVRPHLRDGLALIIFDGVDEVPISDSDGTHAWYPRSLLISGLSEAAADCCHRERDKDRDDAAATVKGPPPNTMLVTSRPYGVGDIDREKLGLSDAPIDNLPDPLQDLLVKRWFSILAEDLQTGRELAGDMISHVRRRHGIDDLLKNPMLLTAMCIIFYEGKRLPEGRWDLCNRMVDTVLFNRFRDPKRIEAVRNELGVIAHSMLPESIWEKTE